MTNPTAKDRLDKMLEYGLSEYEARTYLALLDLGVATARDIANLSRVPRTKIYSILDDLHQKQLTEIIPERPKKYEVVPFDEYLRSFERQYKAKLRQIEEDKKLISAQLSHQAPVSLDRAGSFNVLKGRKNVVNRKYEMIARAKAEILELGSEYTALRMSYYMPILREKAEGSVDVRFLCPVSNVNVDTLTEFSHFGSVRHYAEKTPGSATLIVDDAEVLICHYVPDDEHLFKGEDVAIWSDDRAIVADMKATVKANWDASQELARRIDDILAPASDKEVAQ
ncbi:MAG: hypothetical protein HY556_11315 [Euryarchaeota archaeon]|nr:hypothetical protein [Euryarchaeota archaeon]